MKLIKIKTYRETIANELGFVPVEPFLVDSFFPFDSFCQCRVDSWER